MSTCGIAVTLCVVIIVMVYCFDGPPMSHQSSLPPSRDELTCFGFKVLGICFDNRTYHGSCYGHNCCGPDEMYYQEYCYFIILRARSIPVSTNVKPIMGCTFRIDDLCYAYRVHVGTCRICCSGLHQVLNSDYCYYGIVNETRNAPDADFSIPTYHDWNSGDSY